MFKLSDISKNLNGLEVLNIIPTVNWFHFWHKKFNKNIFYLTAFLVVTNALLTDWDISWEIEMVQSMGDTPEMGWYKEEILNNVSQ